mmetsp:Transcript_19628/g.26616  ORF Transcript_19628/g.26616 Transcript_19628/m.26616 type:complete len:85 (-) Transcript_19628:620-874(-)
MYKNGRAVKWFKKAAQQRHAQALGSVDEVQLGNKKCKFEETNQVFAPTHLSIRNSHDNTTSAAVSSVNAFSRHLRCVTAQCPKL